MHRWLIVLLRILFPLDPVAQLREVTRYFLTTLIDSLNIPDWMDQLEALPEARAILEAKIASGEEGLKLLIHERACQLLGHAYAYTGRPREYPRRHGRSLKLVLARLNRVLALQDRVEELAQRRAARMRRERDANPLGLTDPLMMIRDLHDDRTTIIIPRDILHRRRRGRRIATSSSRDGLSAEAHRAQAEGGCALARGPPPPAMFDFRNLNPEAPLPGTRPRAFNHAGFKGNPAYAPNWPATRSPSFSRIVMTNPPSGC